MFFQRHLNKENMDGSRRPNKPSPISLKAKLPLKAVPAPYNTAHHGQAPSAHEVIANRPASTNYNNMKTEQAPASHNSYKPLLYVNNKEEYFGVQYQDNKLSKTPRDSRSESHSARGYRMIRKSPLSGLKTGGDQQKDSSTTHYYYEGTPTTRPEKTNKHQQSQDFSVRERNQLIRRNQKLKEMVKTLKIDKMSLQAEAEEAAIKEADLKLKLQDKQSELENALYDLELARNTIIQLGRKSTTLTQENRVLRQEVGPGIQAILKRVQELEKRNNELEQKMRKDAEQWEKQKMAAIAKP